MCECVCGLCSEAYSPARETQVIFSTQQTENISVLQDPAGSVLRKRHGERQCCQVKGR